MSGLARMTAAPDRSGSDLGDFDPSDWANVERKHAQAVSIGAGDVARGVLGSSNSRRRAKW